LQKGGLMRFSVDGTRLYYKVSGKQVWWVLELGFEEAEDVYEQS
jgi:hypothetical protein